MGTRPLGDNGLADATRFRSVLSIASHHDLNWPSVIISGPNPKDLSAVRAVLYDGLGEIDSTLPRKSPMDSAAGSIAASTVITGVARGRRGGGGRTGGATAFVDLVVALAAMIPAARRRTSIPSVDEATAAVIEAMIRIVRMSG